MARRQRPAGRKVYYPTWSHNSAIKAMPRRELIAEAHGRARYKDEKSIAAREAKQLHREDVIINTLGLNRGADNEPREKVLDQLSHMLDLSGLDRHAVVFKGLKKVRIMFWSVKLGRLGVPGKPDKYWFVERDLFKKTTKRSIEYDTRELAWHFHEYDRITWAIEETL